MLREDDPQAWRALVGHCDALLAKPMPDDAFNRLLDTMNRLGDPIGEEYRCVKRTAA